MLALIVSDNIKKMKIKEKLIEVVKLQRIEDDGILYITQSAGIPFDIKRVYCIVDPATDLPRGYHAHRQINQAVFCIKGGVVITLDNGQEKAKIALNEKNPGRGVLQRKMVWIEMNKFEKGTIILVLASDDYNPGEYIRGYTQFIKEIRRP